MRRTTVTTTRLEQDMAQPFDWNAAEEWLLRFYRSNPTFLAYQPSNMQVYDPSERG